jgi:hypothetical protein
MSSGVREGEKEGDSKRFLRRVYVADAFLFFTDAENYSGEFAFSLPDFSSKLEKMPFSSVEFHFRRSDIEKWIGKTIGDQDLSSRIHSVDRSLRGEQLRNALIGIIRKRLDELGFHPQNQPE